MHITRYDNTNFNGKIITKGSKWKTQIKEAFESENAIKQFLEKHPDKDVVGYLSEKKVRKNNVYHFKGQKIYRLSIAIRNTDASLFEKIKTSLGLLNKKNVTQHYHSIHSLLDSLNKRAEKILSYLLKK